MNTQTIALIGLSGAGKSTVARILAAQTLLPLIDLDALIVQRAGLSIPTLFSTYGESHFRDLEATALAEACTSGPTVVATGGGVVLRDENRALLRANAFVVWLDAPVDALVARLQAHDEERPLLTGDDPAARLRALRAARAPLYAEVAHLRAETNGRDAMGIAADILNAMPQTRNDVHQGAKQL